ncbi:hypothetical protein, partial [Actinomadura geliboluensis]
PVAAAPTTRSSNPPRCAPYPSPPTTRRTARARGGDVAFVAAGTGGPGGGGAVAVARIPGVLGAEAVR